MPFRPAEIAKNQFCDGHYCPVFPPLFPKSNEGPAKSNHGEVTKPSITKKQVDIVNFCYVPRTAKEIMDRLGITNQTKNRQHYITLCPTVISTTAHSARWPGSPSH